jgi:late competence protein required for DNA uptake (superfamily II DNA/RNA helicase)
MTAQNINTFKAKNNHGNNRREHISKEKHNKSLQAPKFTRSLELLKNINTHINKLIADVFICVSLNH